MNYYKLRNNIFKDHIFFEIQQGMYDLPQYRKLENDFASKWFEKHGSHKTKPLVYGAM